MSMWRRKHTYFNRFFIQLMTHLMFMTLFGEERNKESMVKGKDKNSIKNIYLWPKWSPLRVWVVIESSRESSKWIKVERTRERKRKERTRKSNLQLKIQLKSHHQSMPLVNVVSDFFSGFFLSSFSSANK